jgi:hypothetical protein
MARWQYISSCKARRNPYAFCVLRVLDLRGRRVGVGEGDPDVCWRVSSERWQNLWATNARYVGRRKQSTQVLATWFK